MLWENSSVVVVAVVAAVLARYFLDNFSKKSSFLVIFHQKLRFCDIFFLKVIFSPKNFRRRHACPHFSVLFWRKYAYVIKQSSFFDKNCHFWSKTDILGNTFFKGNFSAINFPRRHVPSHFSACFDRGPFNHISNIYIYIYIYK